MSRLIHRARYGALPARPSHAAVHPHEAPCPSPIVRPESARRGVGQGVGQNDLGLGQVDLIRTAQKLDGDATHSCAASLLCFTDVRRDKLLASLFARRIRGLHYRP